MLKNYLFFILIGICSFMLNVKSEIVTRNDDANFPRLSEYVVPNEYQLWIEIDLNQLIFYGNVTIIMDVLEVTNTFKLNSKELTIDTDAIQLTNSTNSNQIFPLNSLSEDENGEVIEFLFFNYLPIGKYELFIKFSGNIRNDLTGLYFSTYKNDNNENVRLAVTQMEATYARRVFPCFDEPQFKAYFQINIINNRYYTAISNMPVNGDVLNLTNDLTLTQFQITNVPMSTYLVGFIVSDYEYYSQSESYIRIFAPPHQKNRLTYSLEFAKKSLNYLEEFLGHQYQLPKADLVSIPDFSFGAMENWGLITFREPLLYYDEDNPTLTFARNHQSGTLLITHELAHMWFGNEVTPEWWKYIWLSEGFARFFEYYATSQLVPQWRLMDQYIVNNVQSSMGQDDKITARPMTYDVSNPTVINNLFDYIVYAKSSSILRMFQCAIGLNVFASALNKYITARSYQTTNPDYLFEQFQMEVDAFDIKLPEPFKLLIETWSNQPGYPVVYAERNYETFELELRQERFLMDQQSRDVSNFSIPITITTSLNSNFDNFSTDYWLLSDSIRIADVTNSNQNWIILNKQVIGYYRVNYDRTNWQLLINVLNSTAYGNIHVLNRAQLIDDSINLVRANLLDIDIALDILNYIRRETDFIPWSTAANAFTFLERMLRGTQFYDTYQLFLNNLTASAYPAVKLVNTEKNHILRLHRLNVAKWACHAGLPECVTDAKIAFNVIVDDSYITDEIHEMVYCTIARHSSNDESLAQLVEAYLFTLFVQNSQGEEMSRAINGYGCNRNPELLKQFLEVTLNLIVDTTAAQRIQIFRATVQGSYEGTVAGLEFLNRTYTTIQNRYPSMTEVFNIFGPYIVSTELIDMLSSIIIRYSSGMNEAVRNAAVRAVKIGEENIQWIEKHEEAIDKWFKTHVNIEAENASNNIIVNVILLLTLLILSLLS